MKIKLAAIQRADGTVFTGRNHAEIILTREKGEFSMGTQGFITDDNMFVDRKTAAAIAFAAKQTNKLESLLFSEDITGDWSWAKEVIAKLEAKLAAYKNAAQKWLDLAIDGTGMCFDESCEACKSNQKESGIRVEKIDKILTSLMPKPPLPKKGTKNGAD